MFPLHGVCQTEHHFPTACVIQLLVLQQSIRHGLHTLQNVCRTFFNVINRIYFQSLTLSFQLLNQLMLVSLLSGSDAKESHLSAKSALYEQLDLFRRTLKLFVHKTFYQQVNICGQKSNSHAITLSAQCYTASCQLTLHSFDNTIMIIIFILVLQ